MMFDSILNLIGGIPDTLMTMASKLMIRKSKISYDEYVSQLRFYQQEFIDKKKYFLELPKDIPEMKEIYCNSFLSKNEGEEILYSFASRYEVKNKFIAEDFNKFEKNNKAKLFLWKHKDNSLEREKEKTRPLVLCIHGFMMGDKERAKEMFKIEKMFKLGLNVALYILPHHGLRNENMIEQYFLNPENIPLTIETMAQNIHDLHSSVLWLKTNVNENIGIIGASLGGYTAALYATLYSKLDFIFYVVPAVNFYDLFSPSSEMFRFKITDELRGLTRNVLTLITPEEFDSKLEVEKMSVVMHEGDKLNDSKLTKRWIQKWKIQNYIEVPGGHWLYFDSKVRGKTWYSWLIKHKYI